MSSNDSALFDEYKLAVLKNLKQKKMDFGPHQKSAFEEVIVRELDKLRAENAELKMDVSPDELLPIALMNARLIEENEELRKLVWEAYKFSGMYNRMADWSMIDCFERWSAQHPILSDK